MNRSSVGRISLAGPDHGENYQDDGVADDDIDQDDGVDGGNNQKD